MGMTLQSFYGLMALLGRALTVEGCSAILKKPPVLCRPGGLKEIVPAGAIPVESMGVPTIRFLLRYINI
jgi:hypothetical protein